MYFHYKMADRCLEYKSGTLLKKKKHVLTSSFCLKCRIKYILRRLCDILCVLLWFVFCRFSLFHLEFQPQTVEGTGKLLMKHYRNQALFELYTLIFGLDVLGNPVSVVRGVVIGAKDLFYEPFKVSVDIFHIHIH